MQSKHLRTDDCIKKLQHRGWDNSTAGRELALCMDYLGLIPRVANDYTEFHQELAWAQSSLAQQPKKKENRLLPSYKKRWNHDICCYMDGSEEYHTELGKGQIKMVSLIYIK